MQNEKGQKVVDLVSDHYVRRLHKYFQEDFRSINEVFSIHIERGVRWCKIRRISL